MDSNKLPRNLKETVEERLRYSIDVSSLSEPDRDKLRAMLYEKGANFRTEETTHIVETTAKHYAQFSQILRDSFPDAKVQISTTSRTTSSLS